VVHTLTGDRQGGSTITQQLARNLYPEQIGRARSALTRKLREAITALKIEAVYSKDEILESYLNTVPFLYNAHGIEMAARTYFRQVGAASSTCWRRHADRHAQGHGYYNPVLNPERAGSGATPCWRRWPSAASSDKQLEVLKKRPCARLRAPARAAGPGAPLGAPAAQASSSTGPTATATTCMPTGWWCAPPLIPACRPWPTRPWRARAMQLQGLADGQWARARAGRPTARAGAGAAARNAAVQAARKHGQTRQKR
jgi:penicillin-binding protein 1A